MNNRADLRTPEDAALMLAAIEETFNLGTDNDLRTDLDEIRMAFEALAAYESDDYTRVQRPAEGDGSFLIGQVKPQEEAVNVYRVDDPGDRLSARNDVRSLSFENLRRKEEQ